jgi:hypothetical protein
MQSPCRDPTPFKSHFNEKSLTYFPANEAGIPFASEILRESATTEQSAVKFSSISVSLPILSQLASSLSMRHYAIHIVNSLLLVITLIGVPAATSVRLGSLQIGSRPASEMVTLGLLGMALAINLFGWLFLGSKRKTRQLWFRWSCVHLFILTFELIYFEGYFSFDWLQNSLLWLKSRL